MIEGSEVSILCSGWLKANVFETIRASIEIGIERNASITIFSSKAETQPGAIEEAQKIKGLRHVIVAGSFMHSKLYYFKTGAVYTAIIGSANLTDGGLNGNLGDDAREGCRDPREVVPWSCEAVGETHENRIVHRDGDDRQGAGGGAADAVPAASTP